MHGNDITWEQIFHIGDMLNHIDNIAAVSAAFNYGLAVESCIIVEELVEELKSVNYFAQLE